MAKTSNKRVIYLFVLTRNPHTEDPNSFENVEPLTYSNAYDYLNPECYNICRSFGGMFKDGNVFFKNALSNPQVGDFVQKLRDSMDTKLFFAVKKGGVIWGVDKSGEYDCVQTPDGLAVIKSF